VLPQLLATTQRKRVNQLFANRLTPAGPPSRPALGLRGGVAACWRGERHTDAGAAFIRPAPSSPAHIRDSVGQSRSRALRLMLRTSDFEGGKNPRRRRAQVAPVVTSIAAKSAYFDRCCGPIAAGTRSQRDL
jgi:hypothetical protein